MQWFWRRRRMELLFERFPLSMPLFRVVLFDEIILGRVAFVLVI